MEGPVYGEIVPSVQPKAPPKNCTSASIRAFKSAAFALSRKFVDPGGFVPSKYF